MDLVSACYGVAHLETVHFQVKNQTFWWSLQKLAVTFHVSMIIVVERYSLERTFLRLVGFCSFLRGRIVSSSEQA